MTRQMDLIREERQTKRDSAVVRAVEYELEGSVGHAGGTLHGFSVAYRGSDTLLVLRATVAGRRQVAFVGAEDLSGCLVKAVRDAMADRLNWRADRYQDGDKVDEREK